MRLSATRRIAPRDQRIREDADIAAAPEQLGAERVGGHGVAGLVEEVRDGAFGQCPPSVSAALILPQNIG